MLAAWLAGVPADGDAALHAARTTTAPRAAIDLHDDLTIIVSLLSVSGAAAILRAPAPCKL
jgi:hypothetical protein